MENKDKPLIYALIIVIIVLVLIMVFFAVRTYSNYNLLKSHRHYFRQKNITIQSWMNVHSVLRVFNVSSKDLSKELGMNLTSLDQRSTLESICNKKNLNCTQVVYDLNQLTLK